MHTSQASESFRGLLLRHRGRTGLTQRDLATRAGCSMRSVQDWEAGVNYPTADRLRAIIRALLEAGGLTAGRETSEARELWTAVEREARRMHASFDDVWFADLLAAHASPASGPPSDAPPTVHAPRPGALTAERTQDWGEAPDTMGFVGRAGELVLLRRWVLDEQCRLVAVLGMGGIGKTSLAAKLAEQVSPSFERIYWRSLRDAPPPGEWLAGVIGFLSDQQVVPPESETQRIAVLLQLLRQRRCLLVLDNLDTLFEPGQREGRYRDGMSGYGQLLRAVGEASHQSCVVLTSRESPPELAVLGGGTALNTLELGGLGVNDTQVLLAPKQLEGAADHWADLNDRFGGNGLALKVVGETIRELFNRDIGAFLETTEASSVFGGIRRLLFEQVERSSALEQRVLQALAVDREPVHLATLLGDLGPRVGRVAVLEAIEALRRRSLVERAETPGMAPFTLQSVVLEYVTEGLVAAVVDEIEHGKPVVLVEQPIIKAQVKDYVRECQERLIGAPILQQLDADYGGDGAIQLLMGLLETWRGSARAEQGYGPGNVINLLRLLRGDLRELDLSRLAIRQAYLAKVDARDASLVDTHLSDTVLAEAFDFPGSVALSLDGALLAVGTATGQIWLWRVADRTPLWAERGPTGIVWDLALSADGQLLASGGADGTVRLWETSTGRPIETLRGHSGGVWGVALSADGKLVASGGTDGDLRVWEPGTGRQVAILQGHTGMVYGVAMSADGRLLASGGEDGTVRVWSLAGKPGGEQSLLGIEEAETEQPLWISHDHTGTVYTVALSADGRLLATGGEDGTVRLWSLAGVPGGEQSMLGIEDADTGQPLWTSHGHSGTVYCMALSADGRLLATGGTDGTLRLWETSTGSPLATMLGHTGAVSGVALSADGRLASGGGDGTVRLWETSTARPEATLQGLTGGVWGVALSPDGRLVASGGTDGVVRLWETTSGRALAALRGHSAAVFGVALSTDGRLLASGGGDGTVRLWEAASVGVARIGAGAEWMQQSEHAPAAPPREWRPLARRQGHTGAVRGVALSADGRLLASAGTDGAVRLWEASHGGSVATLRGHTGGVFGVALSANAQLVASGGTDGTVRLWETSTGLLMTTLQGPASGVRGVALSADGGLLASGGTDGSVRLWEAASASVDWIGGGAGRMQQAESASAGPPSQWRPVATVHGHPGGAYCVAVSADRQLLASGGTDGTVRLWEGGTGLPLTTLTGHTGGVWGVALSADGQLVASGGFDGTVRLWEASTGTGLRTLQAERRYERMDITRLTGITDAQRQALLSLGAVDRSAGPASAELAGSRSESQRSV